MRSDDPRWVSTQPQDRCRLKLSKIVSLDRPSPMRLPTLPFGPSRPILPRIVNKIQYMPRRTATAGGGKPAPTSGNKGGWKKKSSKPKTQPGSNNPFLQGMNFDSSDHRIALARGILFSQRPLRGLRLNPQDQIRHETIHRAWLLFQQQRRRQKVTKLKNLENSVARTLAVLKETDEKLYASAVSGSREEEKRFPLVMRIPTETLPTRWNYRWTPMNIRGVGGIAKSG
jgi:hypothetical protein